MKSRLLIAAQPKDGGVARHVVTLVEALPAGRFAVDVACPRDSLTWSSLEGVEEVELHAIRPHRRPNPDDARSFMTLLRLAAELGLAEAVRFLGHREDVPELLAASECALLASDYEGCPLTVVEAMAAGVPVAATDAGGTGELVQPGSTGELGPLGDAEALALALERVLGDPGRAAELGAEGRRVARASLSLERMVERLVGLYEEPPAIPGTGD